MVTLINKFTVTGDPEDFLRAVAHVSEFMQAQPGYLAHEMYRSRRNPNVFVETARWSDADAHRAAVQSEEFRTRVRGLAGLASPDADLYESIEEPAHS